MHNRRTLWVTVLTIVAILGLWALNSTEAQPNSGLPDRVAALEKRVAALEKALDQAVVKNGDKVALKTRAGFFIGATNGEGEINTATPGKPPRKDALADETFVVQRQP